jgi:hypothetical protein
VEAAKMKEINIAGKNIHFTQINDHQLDNFADLIGLNSLAAQVFVFITKMMNKQNACIMSSKVLQERFNRGRQAIYLAVKTLTDKGFLKTSRVGGATMYYVNADVVWKNHGNKKQYAEFIGTIVIAKSEQEKIDEEGFATAIKRRSAPIVTLDKKPPRPTRRTREVI